jgi:hypothetical protein
MNINIKEIFKSDLDPNSTAWWSKDKIDKINFNFNQFLNGGMPGPQGFKGADGDHGYSGAQGYQGFMGAQGYQGAQGPAAPSEWIMHIPDDNAIPAYLFPKVNQTPGYIEQMPAVLKTGYIDPLNESPEDFNGSVKTVYSNPIVGGSGSQRMIGLRLQHATKAADFRIGLVSGNLDMEIGRVVTGDPEFHYLQIADEIIYEILGASYLKITSNTIRFGGNVSTNFIIPEAFSHDEFRFTPDAQFEKILVAEGTNGKVKWIDKKEIFGSFPIGSIISIREDDFNSTNFVLNETISQVGPPYGELQVVYGRGKVGTEYEGWYLCNGQTWKVANGVNEFATPNLNSFNYTIASNGGGQNLINNGGDNTSIIIGGGNIEMNGTQDGSGTYQLDMTIESADVSFQGGTSSTDTYASRMVHIVFLENTNLYWSDSTSTPPAPTTTDIMLTNARPTELDACIKPPIYQYTWTGSSTNEWNTFNHITTTYYLYNYGTTTFAAPGWYKNTGGTARYWNGSVFTAVGICSGTIGNTVNLFFGPSVFDLNGNLPLIGTDYEIDTLTFDLATQLYIAGTTNLASIGWYRDTTTGIRRYWNGSAFVGVTFTEDWIIQVPQVAYTTQFAPSSCTIANTMRTTYIEMTDLQFSSIGYPMGIEEVVGFFLYVHVNWAAGSAGTLPLTNVISQNAPGTSLKYRSAFNNFIIDNGLMLIGKTWGNIDQLSGELDSTGWC